ncbi:MAG: glutamate--cysteine ligase [Pseudomonadales bacterium]|nr:glutamate--cysteine ligase [Pseudomonadales bacterium]
MVEFLPEWGNVRRGIEKESLRVTPEGSIALSAHPQRLGSALTNPYITTDFSEALLEFITPARDSIDECLEFLEAIHRFTYKRLENDELLWVCSMPCPTGDLDAIPLARYGDSNIGRLKTLYRRGLSNRYGSLMQTIAGIHYNFSMPDEFWPAFQRLHNDQGSLQDFRTSRYLHLIRNFHRYSWLLLYLFGASPVTCKCFARGRSHNLEEYDDGTLFLPYATCLRMGDLGYRSEAQKSLFVCYNELQSYVQSLNSAMQTPYPPYQEIGTDSDGNPLQMNTNLLQLENEFYSTIRPKRTTEAGERPLSALLRGGIEYIEVRALDLNPFEPIGISAEQSRFLDAFLLFCLLSESPVCNQEEQTEISANLEAVINRGRDPQLELQWRGSPIKLTEWASNLLQEVQHTAVMLDEAHASKSHAASLEKQREKVANPDLTPSGRLLAGMRKSGKSFYRYAMELSLKHRETLRDGTIDSKHLAILEAATSVSVERQKEIEESDNLEFNAFLAQWNSYHV